MFSVFHFFTLINIFSGTNRVCVTLSKGRRSKRWKRRCRRKLSVTWAKLANRTDTSGSRCQNISSLGSGRWAKQTGDNNYVHPVFNFNSTHRIQSGYEISFDVYVPHISFILHLFSSTKCLKLSVSCEIQLCGLKNIFFIRP